MTQFPTIRFKATNTELDGQLQDLIAQKLEHTLTKYIGNETDLKCEVEFEKLTIKDTGRIYRVEVNFFMGGRMYRAEATENSFEEAIAEVRDEIDKEVRRAKKKQLTLLKRGGRAFKRMMRRGR